MVTNYAGKNILLSLGQHPIWLGGNGFDEVMGGPRSRITYRYGIKFGSEEEADRFDELLLLEKAKEIRGLIPHPKFDLVINGVKIGHYTADSQYERREGQNWVACVEEYKGFLTSRDAVRIKVFQALFQQFKFIKSGPWKTASSRKRWKRS